MPVVRGRRPNWVAAVFGPGAFLAGLVVVFTALHAMRSGAPIIVAVSRPLPTAWWFWLPVGLFVSFLGAGVAGAALGLIRTGSSR